MVSNPMSPQDPETAYGQEAEDIVLPLHEEPENTEDNAEWKLYNLLSLGLQPLLYLYVF